MSNTQGKLTKTYNPYLYLFEKGEWGITPFITTLLRIELRSSDRQSDIINLYTIEPYKSNSLLYEAVAAPCTSLAQSSAGTTVKVSLDIPAAPHIPIKLVYLFAQTIITYKKWSFSDTLLSSQNSILLTSLSFLIKEKPVRKVE